MSRLEHAVERSGRRTASELPLACHVDPQYLVSLKCWENFPSQSSELNYPRLLKGLC